MAITSTDQWWGEKLKIAQQETEQAQAENAQLKLMISGATGQGGSPGQKYKPPVTNPGRGEAVFGTGKDGQRYFEFLKAMKINPNSIMLPFVPKDAETDEDYGEGAVPGHPDWKMAHGKFFNEYGQPIQDPGFGIDRGGNPIRLPHMEQPPEEAAQNRQLHIQKYHQAMAGPDYIGDKLRYGQLDRILNPLGDFRKPTLDQLRIHKNAYPKA